MNQSQLNLEILNEQYSFKTFVHKFYWFQNHMFYYYILLNQLYNLLYQIFTDSNPHF